MPVIRFVLAAPFLFLAIATACGSTTSVPDPNHRAVGCMETVREGGGEIDPPKPGALQCPSGICNYQTQSGCGAGLACRPQFTAASEDVSPGCEASGAGTTAAACSTGSDCAPGYFCAAGACRKQCCGRDWSACDPGESCIRELEVKAGGKVVDSGMDLCFPVNNCDPLDLGPCPNAPGRECKIVDPTGAVACEPISVAQVGDPCDHDNACRAGLTCVLDHCRKLCNAEACGEPSCDADDGGCVHFTRDPAGVGECTPGW